MYTYVSNASIVAATLNAVEGIAIRVVGEGPPVSHLSFTLPNRFISYIIFRAHVTFLCRLIVAPTFFFKLKNTSREIEDSILATFIFISKISPFSHIYFVKLATRVGKYRSINSINFFFSPRVLFSSSNKFRNKSILQVLSVDG